MNRAASCVARVARIHHKIVSETSAPLAKQMVLDAKAWPAVIWTLCSAYFRVCIFGSSPAAASGLKLARSSDLRL